ncbi:hypothetical protein HK405_004917 [Cladochytrium tenue]|nr:hypothetical protein HK405_004917 [Cladochytrium tenue]
MTDSEHVALSASPDPPAAVEAWKRKLLVCIDPATADGGAAPIDWAVANLIRPGDLVILFHVLSDEGAWALLDRPGGPWTAAAARSGALGDNGGDDDDADGSAKTAASVANLTKAVADSILRTNAERHPGLVGKDTNGQKDGVTLIADVILGNVRDEICEKAENFGVDVVVVGRSNPPLSSAGNALLGAVSRALIGSVANYVVHHCRRPVVVVPL